ncbi:PAS domain S-box protein [Massilia agilis]|uniref:histidine kinase n=1 Tax=Massilia agilis TaxID=1811226 RepID=A0ABT2D7M0_9BURK|nr:PAS domain S-box protein [Massilia agilis]MCS0806418.1 PAS domain S-box protein [Massilia agilis]
MAEQTATASVARLEDVLITGELSARPARAPDYRAESQALAALGSEMAAHPHGVLHKLAEIVLALCHADSAGVSILEPDGAAGQFRWRAVAGAFSPNLGGTIPRDTSPCGVVIERNGVMLFRDPGLVFPRLRGVQPRMHETLLAPWTAGSQVVGTVWAIAHSPDRHFDPEDARLLQSVASFASAAHQLVTARDQADTARVAVERQAAERTRELGRSNALLREQGEQISQAGRDAREQHALLAAAMGIDTVGVLFFRLDGKVLAANRGFQRMSGYSEQELVQAVNWATLTPAEFCAVTRAAAAELQETGRTAPYVKQMVRKDGTRWWGLFAPTRLSGSGKQSKCVEFILDITKQKETETALRASEERFRALADGSPALIYQFDANGAAVFLNQRFANVTGCDTEAMLGTGWLALLHPDDVAPITRAVGKAIREQVQCQQRMRFRSAAGDWRWFESHSVPWYGGSGDYRGLVGIAIDITDAVQAERALRAADRRKDEFLATLAHELRNPLAPISNAVHLLGRPDGRRRADRLIGMVERQVKHIVRLVDDLMEVSRITRGKLELQLAPVTLDEVVRGALEISQPAIDQGRHRLAVSLPPEPVTLMADKVRLVQAFANLLNNAARYTDPGGAIALAACRAGDQVVVAVRDTGIGIAPDQLPRVFELFAQVQREGARGMGGLGIGLTMARSLVEMHGGSVAVASDGPGRGSEFTVRLPVAAKPEAVATGEGAGKEHAPLAGLRVLIVDDNRDAADSLAMLLEEEGATVGVTYDGPAALARAQTFAPRAVLLDLGMPGMDGYEVARRMQHDPALGEPLLIALTGWGQDADRRATSASGFDYHLTKPVDLARLTMLLRERG